MRRGPRRKYLGQRRRRSQHTSPPTSFHEFKVYVRRLLIVNRRREEATAKGEAVSEADSIEEPSGHQHLANNLAVAQAHSPPQQRLQAQPPRSLSDEFQEVWIAVEQDPHRNHMKAAVDAVCKAHDDSYNDDDPQRMQNESLPLLNSRIYHAINSVTSAQAGDFSTIDLGHSSIPVGDVVTHLQSLQSVVSALLALAEWLADLGRRGVGRICTRCTDGVA